MPPRALKCPTLLPSSSFPLRTHSDLCHSSVSSGFRKNFPIIKTNQTPGPVAQVNLNPMEVTMHAAVERYPTSESKLESGQLGSDTEIDEQQDDKTKSIGLVINHDSDLESGLAK